MWDCRLQLDGLSRGSRGVRDSSSSNSRGSCRSRMASGHCTNHHHSVSDGVLSYSDSPPNNVQEPHWTSPVPKFNLGELSTSVTGGSRSQTSWFPCSSERRFYARATATSPSFGSPSSLSESSHWESTSKRPFTLPPRNSSSRRSYTSKAVYPLVFRNPVSDCETFGESDVNSIGRLTNGEDQASPYHWPDNSSRIEHKFHKNLAELHKLETSPDPSASSRREGFRWSSASSYDLGLDGERFDVADPVDFESPRSTCLPVTDQKCGVCGKLLWQKSPWSSHRIMRGSDMPTAGVLPCSHVFHAECLEQVTPKTQVHDPPCPSCSKTVGTINECSSVPESLQMALRSIRRSRGVVISEDQASEGNNESPNDINDRKCPRVMPQRNDNGFSSIKNRFKRHFTFHGKVGIDIFSSKVFRRIGSSSSRVPAQHELSIQ